jgi:hypothetical protein
MAGGTAARPGDRPVYRGLSDAGVDHVRELSARAARRAAVAARGARRCDRGGGRDRGARAAADLTGRVRLSGVRATGRAPRPGPVHAHRGRSADRSGVPLHRLALLALPLRTAVHAPELRTRAARPCRWAVGVQGDRGPLEPRGGGADRASGEPTRAIAELGGGVRRPEPGAAAARCGRGAQRHARDAGAGGRAGAHRGGASGQLRHARRRGRVGRRCGHQAHGRPGASLPRARTTPSPRPRAAGIRGVRRAAGGRARRAARLRRAHLRLRERRRRAAAARGGAQLPR